MDGLRPEQWRVDYWFLVQLAWFLFPWISTSQMYARAQNYSYCCSTHEWPIVRPSNQSRACPLQQLCQPASIHTLPPTLLVSPPTCRRLNVQCDLKNSGIVVQSLAIRFPPTLSPNSHTPSLSFLACYPVTSSDILVLSSSRPPRPNPTRLSSNHSSHHPLSILRAIFYYRSPSSRNQLEHFWQPVRA
jgi:hypothetical protein